MKSYFLKISALILLSLGLFSCGNSAEDLATTLDQVLDRAESLDSLVNQEVDKVLTLDSLINRETEKVQKLDSLIDRTSSKLDSIAQGKKGIVDKILN